MTIDVKGFFRNENRRQRKINNLGMLESRRWVNLKSDAYCFEERLMKFRQ
jgi:hypothetical protein